MDSKPLPPEVLVDARHDTIHKEGMKARPARTVKIKLNYIGRAKPTLIEGEAMNQDIERCIECDEPTGRAGIHDDSLYTELGDGPLCEECYDRMERAARKAKETGNR